MLTDPPTVASLVLAQNDVDDDEDDEDDEDEEDPDDDDYIPTTSATVLISKTLSSTLWTTATATQTSLTSPTGRPETVVVDPSRPGNGWYEALIVVHGIIGILVFAAMFPLGGIVIRLLRNSVRKHAGIMIGAYMLALFVLGTGIWIAQQERELGDGHAIIGVVVIAGLFFQPLTGYVHHRLFQKTGSRSSVSYVHMFVGVPLITLGIVNGLLGLRLAHEPSSLQAVYAVVALIIWASWMAVSFIWNRRREQQGMNEKQVQMPSSEMAIRPKYSSEFRTKGLQLPTIEEGPPGSYLKSPQTGQTMRTSTGTATLTTNTLIGGHGAPTQF